MIWFGADSKYTLMVSKMVVTEQERDFGVMGIENKSATITMPLCLDIDMPGYRHDNHP